MMLRLLQDLDALAQRAGSTPAVRSVGCNPPGVFSRRALLDRTFQVAGQMRDRIPAGGTVMLCYPNRPEFIAAFLGVLAADRVVFPIASDSAMVELTAALQRSGAVAAIVNHELAQSLASQFDRIDPLTGLSDSAILLSRATATTAPGTSRGPALLLQSSGTTAEPKIVRRDAESLDAVTANMIHACGFGERDHILAAVPLCHSYGLEHGILAPIGAGSCVHFCDKFDLPAVLAELRDGGITMLPGVPFMFDMLCRTEGFAFPTLRRTYSAGGPLPRNTFDAFMTKFGLPIGQVYGSTEVGSVTFNDPDHADFDPRSVGRAMNGVSIRILDRDDPRVEVDRPQGVEGLVAIAAPSMLDGYADGEPVPLIDGHFLTGDIGRLNETGALTITGRLRLLIDIGGRKVNPLEVEAVLMEHPSVGACVVVAMQLSETVQRLKAIVTRARPDIELSIPDLRRFAQERLSRYKVPRVFEVRDALPMSPAGKVLRRLVQTT
jgi:acyl-CoA synthetase (AMP-forming)/AMP-acid ligase II